MKFDDVVSHLGDFGRYQQRLYYTLCTVGIFAAFQMLVPVFSLDIPAHRCMVPGLANDTYAIQNEMQEALVNWSIPWGKGGKRDSCRVYNTTGLDLQPGSPANTSVLDCDHYVYDTSVFTSTVITELNLVCGQEHLRSHANMLMMGGVLVGALGLGILSDLVGRKTVLLLSVLLMLGSGVGSAFAPDYISFVILRFLTGVSNSGLFMSAFVIGMELVGPSGRTKAGIIIELFWCLGLFILSGIAYGIRDWRHLHLAIGVPTVLLLALYWLVPESPRWLASRGKDEQAEKILRKAAEVNKVDLPPKIFDKSTLESGPQGKVWELLTHPSLCLRTLIIFFNWAVASMVYYGLGLNVGNLGGDIFVNFTIANVVEAASYVLCLLLLDRAGRKFLHCASMILGGLACLATIFPVLYGNGSLQWLTITLAMVGKLGASAAFAIIYVFSAELFPTVVRNSGMGASSCAARVGSMVSPYIADLGTLVKTQFGQALPLIVFGALAVAAGVLALLLPETLNKKLPETIEEAKNFGQGSGKNVYQLEVLDEKPKEVNGTYNKAFEPDSK